jgi:site-specific recombinase XerD
MNKVKKNIPNILITIFNDKKIGLIIEKYYEYLKSKSLSENTIRNYFYDLIEYFKFCRSNKISPISSLNPTHHRSMISFIISKGIKRSSVIRKISAIRSFDNFLERFNYSKNNYSDLLSVTKKEKLLPNVMTIGEINSLISAVRNSPKYILRDEALIELIYSSGLRVSEASKLTIGDINFDKSEIKIVGKGNKERIVILGKYASSILKKYLPDSRKTISLSSSPVFRNKFGKSLTPRSIQRMIKKYIQLSGLDSKFSTHSIRHSFATHMLDGGADLKVIQQLLGHSSPETTKIYTHVSSASMKEIYDKAHPRASKYLTK